MKLFSPIALGFLFLVPVLVLMYILKQRYEERQVSSLYLWQQVIMDLDATSPFQRLKRNILFFLQLLILLLCIFALANPFISWKNNNYQNIVIVIDNSGSMSAMGKEDTKLEEAKKDAEDLINSLSSGSRVTLISAARNVKVQISGSSNKKEILKELYRIEPSNSAGNIEDSYSLVKAICEQFQSYRVTYFTDKGMDLKGLNGEVIIQGPQRPNVSLDYMADTKMENGLKVLLRVTNHSNESSEAEICLYGDDKLISVKNETVAGGETRTVYFDNVPKTTAVLSGELSAEDGLLLDNKIYSVVKQANTKKILLSSDQNVFLEKALNTLKDIEVFKTLPGEKINGEFDVYIYDGNAPENIPRSGSLLFINPERDNSLFKVEQEIEGGSAEIETHAITKHMDGNSFVVARLKSMEVPYWASPLIKVGEENAAFAGEMKGQKIVMVGFDLHNSDLPLLPEFPIFINNIISFLIDRDTMMTEKFTCGDSIDITPLPEAEKIFVKGPDNSKTELSSKYPIGPFENTRTPGIYEISQKIGEKDSVMAVAVNFPVSESGLSDTGTQDGNENAAGADDNSVGTSGIRGVNLLNILLLMALLVILLEWVAYIRQ